MSDVLVNLGAVATIVAGQSPPGSSYNEIQNGLPFFQGKAEFGLVHPTPVKWCTAPTKLAEAGDILISVRAPVGPTNVAAEKCCIGRGLAAIRPDPIKADADFVHWALIAARPALERKATGSTFPAINRSDLAELRIPLPPLEQQRRIVGLLNRAADIRRRADAARAKARVIIPALFLDMFGDPATNPKGWPTQRLVELADIGSGLTKGRKLNGAATIPTPYLRVANVQADRLDLSEIKLIDATEDDRQRCRLATNDLLMTEGGDIDKLGRCAIWRGQIELCLHQNHVFRVRMGKSVVPTFAQAFMQCEAARGYFLRVAKRTTGIASINKTQLGQLPVWVPPLPLQTTFADLAQRLEATVGALDAAATKAKAMAEAVSAQVFG